MNTKGCLRSMELFNKYGNSEVQFLLDLFNLPRPFSAEDSLAAALENHVYPEYGNFSAVIDQWVNTGLLEKTKDGRYRPAQNLRPFTMPPGTSELSFLQDIISTREAELFLDEVFETGNSGTDLFNYIQRRNPQGRETELKALDKTVFRSLLDAIYHKAETTLTGPGIAEKPVIPYRLEVSVLDGIWRLIAYCPETDAVSWIPLRDVRSAEKGKPSAASEKVIQAALFRELEEEPVELLVRDEKNALDRCFLAFSSMPELEAAQLDEKEYSLRFRPFRRERDLLLRQLLYLGEYVELRSPEGLKNHMIRMLQDAITLQNNCRQ